LVSACILTLTDLPALLHFFLSLLIAEPAAIIVVLAVIDLEIVIPVMVNLIIILIVIVVVAAARLVRVLALVLTVPLRVLESHIARTVAVRIKFGPRLHV